MPPDAPDPPALETEGLAVHFRTGAGLVRAVDGVDLAVAPGAVHGLVGESGCGKTTLARAVVGLQPATAGAVRVAGRDAGAWRRADRRGFARAVQFVFQDPLGSMSRRQTVAQTLEEPLQIHGLGGRAERRERAARLLDMVALPRDVLPRLPRALSGGQRQRVAIARALALEPRLLVCDEPLSALDVSVRAQVVELLLDLRDRLGLTVVIVAHDLAVVRELCDAVTVMYLGRVAEEGRTGPLFDDPAHPYAQALLAAVPSPDPREEAARPRVILEGDPPSPLRPPPGCRFQTRCPLAFDRCRAEEPALRPVPHGGRAACHLADAERHGRVWARPGQGLMAGASRHSPRRS